MARKNPLRLGAHLFPTQKAAGDALRTILHGTPLNTPLQGAAHAMLIDLVQRHPEAEEKIGVGIAHFEIRENHAPMCKVTKGFWIVRPDGTSIDFSYLICLRGQARTLEEQFAIACRDAVRLDIHQWKAAVFAREEDEEGFVQCAVSGELLLWEWAHVDHSPPMTFEVIVADFCHHIRSEGIALAADLFTRDGEKLFTTFADNGLAERFRAHHERICTESANLRLVSEAVNLTARTRLKPVPMQR